MRLLVLVLTGCLNLLRLSDCQQLSVIRHSEGDIFTLEGSCTEACTVLSSGTASSYTRSPSTAALVPANNSCTCQCNHALPTFREDLRICVNDIHECKVAGFVSNSGQVERVPYVFLPQRGQIIYPHAEIRFEGVTTPVCGIAGAQQLGRSGWSELRNLSDSEPPFRLFRDEGRTFLQWIGEVGLRDAAEGRVVTAKLVCRDASPKSVIPSVFTPCVAFRVAGSPSKNNIREVMFSSSSQVSQGLSATEYTAIGLSSVILALIYVASVSLYLHSRKAKRRIIEEPEASLTRDGGGGLVKSNPLLSASRHFESDTTSGLTESDLADELPPSDGEQGFDNVTSVIVHPHCVYLDHSEGVFGAGSILGERLPEEDVRVVETVDSHHQQDVPVLPGTQRRKLYFNPAYFDRQLLLAPPPAAIEFLLKIREVISIAKHKMAAKRFVPTLIGIPEEESSTDQCGSAKNQQRSSSGSVQGSVTKSQRKSQRCTGCPGCADSLRNLPALPGPDQANPGESKVRAWLEDVRPPQRRWRDAEDTRKDFQENARTFSRNLEYLKELARREFSDPETGLAGKTLATWKDNPPMLRTFQNIARSEILESDDRHSLSKRSTKSMFEGTTYDRKSMVEFGGNDAINAKVRKAIENSFVRQMEENDAMEKETKNAEKAQDERKITFTDLEERKEATRLEGLNDSDRKEEKLSSFTKKELPDMINELPGTKSTNTAKRIMDAVIREMVDVKALGQHTRSSTIADYEVDSLERSKCSRKSSTSPESTDQSSPALSTALPMDEELTMQNAVINTRTGEMTISKLKKDILERNYYNNLPELISSQRPEAYSLVSEVYVNDGYASPACSDDSGPEIQYEPENPGHLTIKVQDSPENYIKQDESEYEPDTLDRKPMKLRINDDIYYDKEITNETYMDSLERPSQILLRSKGSFRDQDSPKGTNTSLQRGYGSLREIYEARLRSNLRDSNLMSSSRSLNGHSTDDSLSWKKCKYLRPESRQARRQRQPYNHPDVVPLPPSPEEIYQRPKPPRRVEEAGECRSKNGRDRSSVEAGDPTASNVSPVPTTTQNVGNTSGRSCPCPGRPVDNAPAESDLKPDRFPPNRSRLRAPGHVFKGPPPESPSTSSRSFVRNQRCPVWGSNRDGERQLPRRKDQRRNVPARSKDLSRSADSAVGCPLTNDRRLMRVEDSGYLSSTDSNGSQKRLLKHEVSSVSETDETESICDGASESGAESVGTDSVFFGNFRRLSEISAFSKSADSGVDLCARNSCLQVRNEANHLDRLAINASDSETESFITVLPPRGSYNQNQSHIQNQNKNKGQSHRNSLVS